MAALALSLAVALQVGAPAASADTLYTVRPHDTLNGIAARANVPVALLAAANGIENVDLIFPGTTLRIPGSSNMSRPSSTTRPGTAPPAMGTGRLATVPGLRHLPTGVRSRPDRVALVPAFRAAASAHGVPADLLMATCWMESGWQPGAVSKVGAQGLCQIMPFNVSTFNAGRPRPYNPMDARDSMEMSARMLRSLITATGSEQLALAAYYQGLPALRAGKLYDDTKTYVATITALRPSFR